MQHTHISRLLSLHFNRYPASQLQDLCKLLFQHTFGPGHLIADKTKSLARIQTEAALPSPTSRLYDPIGNGLARIHLGALPDGCSLETLNQAFLAAASSPHGTSAQLKQALAILNTLCGKGGLPFSSTELEAFSIPWAEDGFPALHHSSCYRKAYAPSYRVVPEAYPRYLPLFCAIDQMLSQRGRCILAIDGDSCAGKTALSQLLHQIYSCTVLHMDDFFLPANRKTASRFHAPGNNVDWERFLAEIIPNLQAGTSISYRRFDCRRQALEPPVSLPFTPLIVIEGSYSHHPQLRSFYDLTAFLSLPPSVQAKRLARRTPALLSPFLTEWIPLEKAYQTAYSIPEASQYFFSARDWLEEM